MIKTDKVEIRKHLGLVPQDIALLEELNAVDNLEYFGGLYGLAGAELKSQIEKLLEVARSNRQEERESEKLLWRDETSLEYCRCDVA